MGIPEIFPPPPLSQLPLPPVVTRIVKHPGSDDANASKLKGNDSNLKPIHYPHMKKLIKSQDIKKIVKTYSLSEEEVFWIEDIAEDINSEQNKARYDTMLSFLCSPNCFSLNAPRYDALASILHHFGIKTQQTTGQTFHETCEAIGFLLNATPAGIERIFRGMSFSNKRWQKLVYIADKCGLNTMELYIPN